MNDEHTCDTVRLHPAMVPMTPEQAIQRLASEVARLATRMDELEMAAGLVLPPGG